ncbi:protein of unknown function [Cupriavidus taiwanensis]|uniref:Uncharacterized protein n=1 Tax=Cupriavidus taiwanensis TaxID=164546 RepID=A0A375DMR0_9BURK|nr:protein of unknown function [Cupriavidus taiwanensis]SOZ06036.1 hypothetical protein CBM2595_A80721 [Cupriavidus taiwanensis]SOZ08022.1 hypothetical protein CBM2597_A90628 [Cupriavidus taiwanensis]SPC11901.1 hypothetical protein CT19431_40600 [Cupriavidus taiwanensis]SPC18565.1 hypothetical protein CBM2594_A80004 [Cupriavidus taiwanensis]
MTGDRHGSDRHQGFARQHGSRPAGHDHHPRWRAHRRRPGMAWLAPPGRRAHLRLPGRPARQPPGDAARGSARPPAAQGRGQGCRGLKRAARPNEKPAIAGGPWMRTGPDHLGHAVSSSVILYPCRLPMIPPMTRTPIRTTRRVAGRLATGVNDRIACREQRPNDAAGGQAGAFSSAPCGHPVCSRLQYRRGAPACNQQASARHAGDESLTYPVTFSQCNKILALCYNPRREFRNCEIRQAPGFLPGRIRCPPKLCFLAAGRLITMCPSRPAERTAHLTSPRLRSC